MRDPLVLGEWTVHPGRSEIARGGTAVRIEPLTMQLLLLLADNFGRTVSRDEIVAHLWSGRIVSEDAITKQISKLRSALGDDPRTPAILQTVPKVGLRLLIEPHDALPSQGRRQSRQRSRLVLAGIAALLLAGAIAWRGSGEADFQIVERPLTSGAGLEFDPALALDGNWLAYASQAPGEANASLFVRTIADDAVRRLTPEEVDARSPAWSAGGRLAFVANPARDCAIMVGSAIGGFRRISGCVQPLGMAWLGETGLVVANHPRVGTPYRLMLLDLRTGRARALTMPPAGSLGDRSPTVSVDGRTLYFARTQTVGVEQILALDLASGQVRTITAEAAHVTGVSAAGSTGLLVASNRVTGVTGLWRLDLRRMAWRQVAAQIDGAPSADAAGRRIAFEQARSRAALWEVAIASGEGRPRTDTTKRDWLAVAARNGDLAFLSTRSGSRELWRLTAGRTPQRLTHFDGPEIQDPAWSPDGRSIAVAVPLAGNFDIHLIDARSGATRRLTSGASDDRHPAFAADGETLFFSRRTGDRYALVQRSLRDGRETPILADGLRALPSPDGLSLYFSRLFKPGIFRLALDARAVTQVATWPDWPDMRNWTVADGAIWGVSRNGATAALLRLDMTTGTIRRAAILDRVAQPSGLAIRDGSAIYSRSLGADSDLALIELKPARR